MEENSSMGLIEEFKTGLSRAYSDLDGAGVVFNGTLLGVANALFLQSGNETPGSNALTVALVAIAFDSSNEQKEEAMRLHRQGASVAERLLHPIRKNWPAKVIASGFMAGVTAGTLAGFFARAVTGSDNLGAFVETVTAYGVASLVCNFPAEVSAPKMSPK